MKNVRLLFLLLSHISLLPVALSQVSNIDGLLPIEGVVIPKAQSNQQQILKPLAVFKDCDDCPEMIVIPTGKLDLEEKFKNFKLVKSFAIGSTEVTVKMWNQVMRQASEVTPTECGYNCPVHSISWFQIKDFIEKLNLLTNIKYRLPNKYEWQYACLANQYFKYCGVEGTPEKIGWFSANSRKNVHPVATKAPNQWGIYDMSGNVWELVEDCDHNDSFDQSSEQMVKEKSCNSKRVIAKGGSWFNDEFFLESKSILSLIPASKDNTVGFRLARDIP